MITEKKGCLAFAVCGSFCTLENALGAAQALTAQGWTLLPVMSFAAQQDTCTGATLARLAAGLSDTPVTLAAKSLLRGGRPVVLAPSTNDALSGSAPAIAQLLQRRNYYFVPFGQDDSYKKPCSLKSDFTLIPDTLESALRGVQLQPILL